MIPKNLRGVREYLVCELDVILNTGSSIDQGIVMRGGKKIADKKAYKENVAVCFMNKEDMLTAGVAENDRVNLKSDTGEIVLYSREGRCPRGMVFVPKGPWVNSIIDSETYQTGSPHFKGMRVIIKKTRDDILEVDELIGSYD